MNDFAEQFHWQSSWWMTIQRILSGDAPYTRLYYFDRMDRIRMVKHGLPAQLLTIVADDMNVPREKLYGWLGIPRTTANRKVKEADVLSQDESERLLGIACLIGQVLTLVNESGSSEEFNAAHWTASWLEEPSHALRGLTPSSFMDTADGRALVHNLIAQMQSGAYA